MNAPEAEETVWPRSAQAAAALLVLLALLLIACHAYLSGRWATRPGKIQARQTRTADPVRDRDEEENETEKVAVTPFRSNALKSNPKVPAMGKSQKLTEGDARVDLNQASALELQKVPGIGPVTAQRIIDKRREQPFQQVEDLRGVPGIGAKTLEKLKPFVRVASSSDSSGPVRPARP
jgi:competence ComEA-like helix-hairpin-helix protein